MIKLNSSAAAATLLATLLSNSAHAATQLGEYFSLSGFGTLGAVQTNYDEADYVREFQAKGGSKKASLLVDSNLGLQLNAKANDWLSGSVQLLTIQRTEPKLTTKVEWAFVKVTPLEGLALRAGKLGIPAFLISESRRLGYANTWLRPPNEVYSLDVLNGGLTGADATYRWAVGGNSLSITGLAGKSEYKGATGDPLKVNAVRGLNLVWDGDWYTLRAGQVSWSSFFAHSDRSFDCRFLLKGIGWQVAQLGMQTHAVVEADDVVSDVIGGLAVIGVIALPDAFHFEVQEEALHDRVVPTITFAAHAAHQAVLRQQRLMQRAGVLAATVRMHDQARCRLPLHNGQLQRPAHQTGLHIRSHRPAHHLARKQVQHHRQVQPAAARSDVGDVSHPGLVGLRRVELSVQHVG
jgi:hypothetical protein